MSDEDRRVHASPDGTLTVPRGTSRLPMGSARLDVILEAHGRRLRVAVWGGGDVATAALSPDRDVAWEVRPNGVRLGGAMVAVASSTPAVLVRGARPTVRAARQPAPGLRGAESSAARSRRDDGIDLWVLPWGATAVRRDGDATVIGAGADAEEALRGARTPADRIEREADAYARACARLETFDAELGSMVAHGLHAAFAAVKRDARGTFAGLAAGPGYALPARTYFRDAYWTVPALLPVAPERVRDTLELLAAGVHDDGEAPSAVITPLDLPAHVRDAIRARKGTGVTSGVYEHDWWRDHIDSPSFFVLMLDDYVRFTGDADVAHAWDGKVRAILARFADLAPAGGVLPRKPYNERDWADNVFRHGLVTYDLALYHGALRAAARLFAERDPEAARTYAQRADAVRDAADEALWLDGPGHYADYRSDEVHEDHLALDTVTAARFGLADEARAKRLLRAFGATLETRHNTDQPHGDFGVMCCYPPYRRRRDLKAKSAFPFRYHNGADWPYWDGVYADELLKRGDPEWRYPLTRWWSYALERGWPTPVEFHSPPYPPGAPLQAWSAMPAAAVMQGGFGVRPPFEPTAPPWGPSTLRSVRLGTAEARDVAFDGRAVTTRPARDPLHTP